MGREIKPPSSEPAIRLVMMPRDTNADGTIFGGVILSLIDQAAYVEAMRQYHARYVTVAFRAVEFHHPVFVGDLLSLYGDTSRIGKTSITIHIKVCATRRNDADSIIKVTEAEVIFVSVGSNGKPKPIPD
ncbi:MAG: acyl-CoA thioesterase [Planctomycetota bacterium]